MSAESAGPPAAPALARPDAAWLWRDAAITLLALLAVLLWDLGGQDLAVSRAFGNAAGFAWRERWLTRGLLHDGGRWLALAGIACLMLNLYRPLWRGPTFRERVWWLGATLACMVLVPQLKQVSLTSCPWELAEFGGAAHYVSHWRLGIGDGGPGHCFPAGHATSGAAFIAGWFVLRRHQPRAARGWLAAVLMLTAVYGAAQLVRGAHYVSHTLWSLWLCWTLTWLLEPLARPKAIDRSAQAPP